MLEDRIHSEYRRMEEETLEKWRSHPSVGCPGDFPYDRSLLAIAMGQYFEPCPGLSSLFADLREISRRDASIEVPDLTWLHMTFLALSPHRYEDSLDYPETLSIVKDLHARYALHIRWSVYDLRLVPTQNALLLAGLPDVESWRIRKTIAEELLNSHWEPLIRERYKGFPIPPIIWHTTLMRSRREYLPESVRQLFMDNRNARFADIQIGSPILAAVTYNWSRIQIIGDE